MQKVLLRVEPPFDVITSNPPYIPLDEYERLLDPERMGGPSARKVSPLSDWPRRSMTWRRSKHGQIVHRFSSLPTLPKLLS